MGVRSLGYLRLTTDDLAAWETFAGDFLGLMRVEGAPGALSYRMDEFPPRLVVAPGTAPASSAIGFDVNDRRELAALVTVLESRGVAVAHGDADACRERRVTGFIAFDDPAGNRIEVFYGPILDHVPVHTPTVSRFVTGDMGMGHVIVSAEDLPTTVDFYIDVLGFVERNTMGNTVFMGCNPRHHTFGVARRRGPGRLLHLMVETATLDDVGLALDRADALSVPMMNTLGKHTNDQMISFYVYSPERYAVEVGWNGLRVDGQQPTYEITQGAFWGHKFSPPPA